MPIPDRFGSGAQETARHEDNVTLQKEMIEIQNKLVKIAEWQKRFSFALVIITLVNVIIFAKSLV